jgi:hypothetical protein
MALAEAEPRPTASSATPANPSSAPARCGQPSLSPASGAEQQHDQQRPEIVDEIASAGGASCSGAK